MLETLNEAGDKLLLVILGIGLTGFVLGLSAGFVGWLMLSRPSPTQPPKT